MAQQNPPKLLELELQSIGSRLAELGHRRMLNVVQYRKYLADCFEIFGQRPPDTEQPVLDEAEAIRRLVDGQETVSSMAAFAGHYHADRFRQLASGPLTTHSLRRVADNVRNARLGHDVTVDNDPREHGAHAHWRTAAPPTPRSNEPIKATAYLALADEPPALIESVFRMVLGLLVVVLGLGVLNGIDQELDLSRADAIVAVLLLVPGILLTRLDIPNTNTVLGQLRVFQRRLAYASLVATTGLGVVFAAAPADWNITWAVVTSVAVLLLLVACCICEFVMRTRRRRALVPRVAAVPVWLRQDMDRDHEQRLQTPDAQFDAIEQELT
jgi:hypothetical protein